MRIHSDVLTATDITTATNTIDDVWVEDISRHASRSRAYAFEVRLAADAGKDQFGKTRTRRNTGQYGAEDAGQPAFLKAATYDEHGLWIAQLFQIDPKAKIGPYDGIDSFEHQTASAQFWDAVPEVTTGYPMLHA